MKDENISRKENRKDKNKQLLPSPERSETEAEDEQLGIDKDERGLTNNHWEKTMSGEGGGGGGGGGSGEVRDKQMQRRGHNCCAIYTVIQKYYTLMISERLIDSHSHTSICHKPSSAYSNTDILEFQYGMQCPQ